MSTLKYLLISPGTPQTIAQTSNSMTPTVARFPVGLAYISSAMKSAGFETFTINPSFLKSDIESALNDIITKNDIGAVCTGGISLDVHQIMYIINTVRRINPEIKIIAGGAIISSDPETAMNVLDADIGVIGEGEKTMCDIASAINSGACTDAIPGIIFRQNGILKKSCDRLEAVDVNNLPLMDFEGFAYSEWLETTHHAGILHSARSCPFQCTFCFKSTGNKYRQRSLDSVFNEIDHQLEKYHIKSLLFSDELFATNKKRVLDFCNRIKQYNINWGTSLRVEQIEADLLGLMKDSGCNGISTGLESADPEILKSMRKKTTVSQIEKALDIFANSDITMLGNLIFGDTGETKDTINTTLDLWRKYNQRICINLGIVATFPGTHIYENACQSGIIPDREQYLKDGSFIVNITKMSDSDYYDMISNVTELGFLTQIPAKGVKIRDVNDDGFCEVVWQCRRCDTVHTLPHTHFLQAPIRTCSCGIQNTVEPFRGVSCDSAELMAALPEDEVIAFWGVGSQYCRLARFYDSIDFSKFIQIDASKYQQKMHRLGNKIYSPEIIAQKEITSVIVTSPTTKDAILKSIEERYPLVSNVFFPKLLRIEDKFVPAFQPIVSNRGAELCLIRC